MSQKKIDFLGANVQNSDIEVTDSLKATCKNACGLVEEGTGFILDAFSLAREELKPMKIESRMETAMALAKSVTALVEAGFSEEQASQVILGGIEVH
jgi:hypothetical protein